MWTYRSDRRLANRGIMGKHVQRTMLFTSAALEGISDTRAHESNELWQKLPPKSSLCDGIRDVIDREKACRICKPADTRDKSTK